METPLGKWSIFSLLDNEFRQKLEVVFVFGNHGNEALLLTKDDAVYGLGSNNSGCLGVGDTNCTLHPKLLKSLCGKKIVKFSAGGGPHVIALSKTGEVYGWGHNSYYQLGIGNANQVLNPTLIQGDIEKVEIVDICCGSHHTIALSKEGDIYGWGQNNSGQVGNGLNNQQTVPRKISRSMARINEISCGQSSSMALSEEGKIFCWGFNGNGQLGVGNESIIAIPTLLKPLEDVVITKIVSGFTHNMALSHDGHLYTWGANSFGQLGTGDRSNHSIPVKIRPDEHFIDIAASHHSHISAAMCRDGRVLMWGQCRGQQQLSPLETLFRSLHDVMATYSMPAVTYKPMVVDTPIGQTILNSLKLAFDDETTADLRFVQDGRAIHVHKTILIIRSEYFKTMFQNNWKESNENELPIPSPYTFSVYRSYLKYLYTDKVESECEDAVALMDLSHLHMDEILKKRCEEIIRAGVSIENVASLYSTAIKYGARDLEDFSFRFCLYNLKAVIQTDGFLTWDNNISRGFIVRAAEHTVFNP